MGFIQATRTRIIGQIGHNHSSLRRARGHCAKCLARLQAVPATHYEHIAWGFDHPISNPPHLSSRNLNHDRHHHPDRRHPRHPANRRRRPHTSTDQATAMNTWPACALLGALFYAVAKSFDRLIPFRPSGEFWDMAYYLLAATCDWLLFRNAHWFVRGKLHRDIQALYTASIVANAFGYVLYLAWSPPSFYNWIIQGINYAIAIRLIITGGHDVLNHFDNRHGGSGIRRHPIRRSGVHPEKAYR